MALTRSPGVRGETPTNGVTPKDHRLSMEAQMGGRGPGVISGCTVTGTANWQYAVAAGELATRRAPGDGLCVWTNTSQYLAGSASAPAPAAGTSRIDIVYARHNNMQEHGDPDSLPVIDVVRGTASSGTPVAPTLPDGAIELARKTVAAGDSSTSVGAAISHANTTRAQKVRRDVTSTFSSLAAGIGISGVTAVVDTASNAGGTVTMTFHVVGLTAVAGGQNVSIGQLVPELYPGTLTVVPGFFANGALTATISTTGAVALRWSSAADTGTKYFTVSYAVVPS